MVVRARHGLLGSLLGLALATACGGGIATAPPPEVAVLRWGQDAASVGAQIEAHLEKRELVVERDEQDGEEVVMLAYRGQNVPDFLVLVRAAKKPRLPGDTDPQQYLILVHLKTFASVSSERAEVVLEALNAFNAEWAYGAFFLEPSQNEITGVWPIRIADGYPLPLDAVYDAIVELVRNWNQLHPLLLPAGPAPSDAPAPGDEDEAAPSLPGSGPLSRAVRTPRSRAGPLAATAPAPAAAP